MSYIIFREEKVCKGLPCTPSTPEDFTTHQMEEIVHCKPGWTVWINQDKGSFNKPKKRTKKKEFEPLPTTAFLVTFIKTINNALSKFSFFRITLKNRVSVVLIKW